MLFSLMQQEDENTNESSAASTQSEENTPDGAAVEAASTDETAVAEAAQEHDKPETEQTQADDHATEDSHDEAGHDVAGHDTGAHDTGAHGGEATDAHGAHDAHGGPVNYLSPTELFKHVQDSTDFHFPPTITRFFTDDEESDLYHGHVHLPQFNTGVADGEIRFKSPYLKPLDGQLTRFMVVELMAAVLIFVVFTAIAQRIKRGGVPKGRLWNLLEAMIQFVRRDIGQAVIGKKDGAKFAPFLLTIFFFVLGCNLLGMVPGLGAPTGDFMVTSTLALIVFVVVVKAGMDKFGFGGFFKNLVPGMDLPPGMDLVLIPMIFVIEVIGFLIKHFVLAVRLFANMMAGHLVLAAIVAFIGLTHQYWWGGGVKAASVFGATALSILEVFVAFLQAYIFTFLTALFISSATHHH